MKATIGTSGTVTDSVLSSLNRNFTFPQIDRQLKLSRRTSTRPERHWALHQDLVTKWNIWLRP